MILEGGFELNLFDASHAKSLVLNAVGSLPGTSKFQGVRSSWAQGDFEIQEGGFELSFSETSQAKTLFSSGGGTRER